MTVTVEAMTAHQEMLAQKDKHRIVSVKFDDYGTPRMPGVVGIGMADPLECRTSAAWNAYLCSEYKKNVHGNVDGMTQAMTLNYSDIESDKVHLVTVKPQTLSQIGPAAANTLLQQAVKEREANHKVHSGYVLKSILDENNGISLKDFTVRPMRTVSKDIAMRESLNTDARSAAARIQKTLRTDSVDISLPENHELLKSKAEDNAVLFRQYTKLSDIGPNPGQLIQIPAPVAERKAVKQENVARRMIIARSNVDFKKGGYSINDIYTTSSIFSAHRYGAVKTSRESFPSLAKTSRQATVRSSATRSAPELLKLPPLC